MSRDSLTHLRQGLHKHFGPGAAIFVDPFLWLAGQVAVDLLRLDYWLQQRNPDYSRQDSMCGFIRRKYGSDAAQFVRHWIAGEPHQQQENHHG